MDINAEEAINNLLRENKEIQEHLRSKIQNIEDRLILLDNLVFALRWKKNKKKDTNGIDFLETDKDLFFRFHGGSRIYAPPLLKKPSRHCFALAPKFRWNQRATSSLKRQINRMGLDSNEEVQSDRWQVVADAVNYDSKATQCVDSFQCFLHYQHVLTPTLEPFSPEEDLFIDKSIRAENQWTQIAVDIFNKFGYRRTAFQVAQRYRKLKRESYEYNGILNDDDTAWPLIKTENLFHTVPETETIVKCSLKLNSIRKLPWLTEECIRKSLESRRIPHTNSDSLLRQNICAILLSNEDFTSSKEARQIVMHEFNCEWLEISEMCNRARWRYSQISIEEAAERLSSSVSDMKERVLAKSLRWYDSVYTSDFFKLSLDLFGQRDGALVCFLISREYERQRRKKKTSLFRLNLL